MTKLGEYHYENGNTVFPVNLDYGNIELYAFEKVMDEQTHIVSTDADISYIENGIPRIRSLKSGNYTVELSNGKSITEYLKVPLAYDIRNWNLTVESWTPGNKLLYSTEFIDSIKTTNTKVETSKTNIQVHLDSLNTWDNIPEIGKHISGIGHYESSFDWDTDAADGAYLDFGNNFVSGMKIWINGKKVGGSFTPNELKNDFSSSKEENKNDSYIGGINWIKPVIDISDYLVNGKNTIIIEYSSTLTNVALAEGIIKEMKNASNWWNNDIEYQSYGPSQATIIPFAEISIHN